MSACSHGYDLNGQGSSVYPSCPRCVPRGDVIRSPAADRLVKLNALAEAVRQWQQGRTNEQPVVCALRDLDGVPR